VNDLAVVLNPTAGGGRAARIWNELAAADPRLGSARCVETSSRESAPDEIAELLRRPPKKLLVFGGDGSAHLVGNLLLEQGLAGEVSLGIVPAGTGSDLCRSLGIPRDPAIALQQILAADPRAIDVLRIDPDEGEPRFVLNIASVGISGMVSTAINSSTSRGKTTYIRNTLAAIRHYTPVPCRIWTDGVLWREEEVMVLAIANGQVFGDGMWVAPHAEVDDGLADIVLLRAIPKWKIPIYFPRIFRGTHLGIRQVSVTRATHVRLEPLAPLPPIEVDGENIPSGPVEFHVLPGALQVLA